MFYNVVIVFGASKRNILIFVGDTVGIFFTLVFSFNYSEKFIYNFVRCNSHTNVYIIFSRRTSCISLRRRLLAINKWTTEKEVDTRVESFIFFSLLVVYKTTRCLHIRSQIIQSLNGIASNRRSLILVFCFQAVKLESVHPGRTRYLVVVSCTGRQDAEESCLLGIDCHARATVGLVLRVLADTAITLDGDG